MGKGGGGRNGKRFQWSIGEIFKLYFKFLTFFGEDIIEYSGAFHSYSTHWFWIMSCFENHGTCLRKKINSA